MCGPLNFNQMIGRPIFPEQWTHGFGGPVGGGMGDAHARLFGALRGMGGGQSPMTPGGPGHFHLGQTLPTTPQPGMPRSPTPSGGMGGMGSGGLA